MATAMSVEEAHKMQYGLVEYEGLEASMLDMTHPLLYTHA